MTSSAEETLGQYETKINLHTFDEVTSLISDEAVFWFSDGSHTGKTEIRKAFERTWAQIQDEVYRLEDLVWIAQGEKAAGCIYTFHWKGMIKGKPQSGKGRGTTILRKEESGWKIIHEHLSPVPTRS